MSFYLTLPSSVKLSGLEDHNTISHYITQLDRPLVLAAAEWEVGLTEIIFPHSSPIISSGSIKIKFNNDDPKEIPFEYGFYDSFEDIATHINESLQKQGFSENMIKIHYVSKGNKFTIRVRSSNLVFSIDGALAKAMGFGEGTSMGFGIYLSTHPPELLGRTEILYVYSSIAAPRIVGDSTASLLRVFSINERSNWGMEHLEFKHVHYVPIQNLATELIEIDIKRDDGIPVSFNSGKVVVTVHFRRKT